MKWFRFYSEALDDPKVQRLGGDTFKAWVNMLCLANRGDVRGELPPVPDIAFALRMSEAEAERVTAELCQRGLIDDCNGLMVIHGFANRQPDSDTPTAAAERKRKERARKKGKSQPCHCDNDVTVPCESPECRAIDKNRGEKKRVAARKRAPKDWEPSDQHRFLARERSVDFAIELAKFRDHTFSTARSDWDATFRNWLRNAKPGAPMPARKVQPDFIIEQ